MKKKKKKKKNSKITCYSYTIGKYDLVLSAGDLTTRLLCYRRNLRMSWRTEARRGAAGSLVSANRRD